MSAAAPARQPHSSPPAYQCDPQEFPGRHAASGTRHAARARCRFPARHAVTYGTTMRSHLSTHCHASQTLNQTLWRRHPANTIFNHFFAVLDPGTGISPPSLCILIFDWTVIDEVPNPITFTIAVPASTSAKIAGLTVVAVF